MQESEFRNSRSEGLFEAEGMIPGRKGRDVNEIRKKLRRIVVCIDGDGYDHKQTFVAYVNNDMGVTVLKKGRD